MPDPMPDGTPNADTIECALQGTWRLLAAVEESGYSYIHFESGQRFFQLFTTGIPGQRRGPWLGRYAIESPSQLTLHHPPYRDRPPSTERLPFTLDDDTLILSPPHREFRCARVPMDEVAEWFREALQLELARD